MAYRVHRLSLAIMVYIVCVQRGTCNKCTCMHLCGGEPGDEAIITGVRREGGREIKRE